jgi:hypothetical protein
LCITRLQGGLRCKSLLQAELQSVSHVCIIRESTHQIMLDAPADLCAVMVDWIASAGCTVGKTVLDPLCRK